MPTPHDRATFDAAWSAWVNAAHPEESLATLLELLERQQDGAEREVRSTAHGPARAEAIAWQVFLATAGARARSAVSEQRGGARFFADWQTLAALARGSEGGARTELLALAVEAGGGAARLAPACLAALSPLLDAANARAWAVAALDDGSLDRHDQGLLLGVLPEDDVAALLPPRLARAASIADFDERWGALHDLVHDLPERWLRRAQEESAAQHGTDAREAYLLPREAIDQAHEQARTELERARWGAPFTAWRLGDRARELSGAARSASLDRALDEFAAIALTPVSPGNDEGPFWAIARWLDEPQVRRALAIVERMEGADWRGDLGASRAALIGRLALLGYPDEAELLIPRIGTVDSLALHWRAVAWGAVLGARLALDPASRWELLVARAADDPAHLEAEWRFRVLEATVGVFDDRPTPDARNVEAFVAMALSFEPRLRQLSLEHLIQRLPGALPVERWLELVLIACEGTGRVEALGCLAETLRDTGRDPVPALRPLLANLDEQPDAASVWTFRDLCGFRAWIESEDAIARWSDFLRRAAGPGLWHAAGDVKGELPEILGWLAGPHASLLVGRALARAAALPVPPGGPP